MKFSQPTADFFVPDGAEPAAALRRTTDLCMAAHQDDLEIIAHDAIAACLRHEDGRWFTGVVVTDGAGSPRTGRFATCTDEQMKGIRREEQRAAARLGNYSAVVQLAHPSAAVRSAAAAGPVRADLAEILAGMAPRTVYLHNPADKHDTHIGVLLRCLEALRALPAGRRPSRVLGVEVWRDLDWLLDTDKVVLDCSAEPQLARDLVAVFVSQIEGGKRYDLAAAGRRLAHATFHTAHATDRAAALAFAMDLTPLVQDPTRSIEEYTLGYIDRLRADVAARLRRNG